MGELNVVALRTTTATAWGAMREIDLTATPC